MGTLTVWTRRLVGIAVAAVALLLALLLRSVPAAPPIDFDAVCAAGEPYLVTTCFDGIAGPDRGLGRAYDVRAPSVVLLSDTPNNQPQYSLALLKDVGAVWGLAYRRTDRAVYAAAFLKRHLPFGPGGPGAIYRIDLATGDVAEAIHVPDAGADPHQGPTLKDETAGKLAGKLGLGDIDLSDDESELFVMNLNDRRVYRFALPGGALLGSFAHGAAAESWAEDARPFALAYRDGFVFHGVVHSAESTRKRADLVAEVYRSRPDGSAMTRVASVALDYPRGTMQSFGVNIGESVNWQPWRSEFPSTNRVIGVPITVYPAPLVTDLVFDHSGNLVLGLHDRSADAGAGWVHKEPGETSRDFIVLPAGDLLRGLPTGDAWRIEAAPEFYEDGLPGITDQSSHGGLAHLDHADAVVAGAFGTELSVLSGLLWYDNPTGSKIGRERACDPSRLLAYPSAQASLSVPVYADDGEYPPNTVDFHAPQTVGDVETLCRPVTVPSPSPTDMASATPTSSATPVPTATAPTATAPVVPSPTVSPTSTLKPTATRTGEPTATPPPAPIYLPAVIHDPACRPGFQHADVVLVIDASTSMGELTRAGRSKLEAAREAAALFVGTLHLAGGDQAAVVAFNAEAALLQSLSGDAAALQAALGRIAMAQQTRIHRGIAAARAELGGPRRSAGNTPVMIVLTDGRNNPEPVSEALAEAAAAKAAGIRVFTIGLGEDVERAALVEMASSASDAYFAPDGEDLRTIYTAIAHAVPCPARLFWPSR